MVTEKIFEAALGISAPWYIAGLNFEPSKRVLKVCVDFQVGSRFAVPGEAGEHPAHDTVSKYYRHLNFFQHECELEVRLPRVKLPDGSVRQVSPPWAGKLSGFTLLFEAFVLALCREPSASELATLRGFHQRQLADLNDETERAKALLSPELAAGGEPFGPAALVLVCRAIFNTDAFITRE